MGNKKTLELKKWAIIALAIVVAILVIIDLLLILSSVKIGKKDTGEITYIYNTKQSVDYKALLYPNSFIEDEYLGRGQSYLADLVKSIEVMYNYQYTSSKKVNLHYDYNIKAIITGEYRLTDDDSSSKVWTKEYLLQEESEDKEDIYNLNLTPTVSIDYNSYNDIVSEFRKELKLSINANLSVILTTHITGEVEEDEIDDTKTIELVMPLNQQAFKITENYDKEDSKQFTKLENYVEDINYRKLILGVVAQVALVVLTIHFFRLAFNVKPKSHYEKTIHKYLKAYGDIIVEVNTPISTSDLQLVTVKSFEEMIDLEEELRIPMNFYQYPGKEKGEFTIVANNIIYRYILRSEKKVKKV